MERATRRSGMITSNRCADPLAPQASPKANLRQSRRHLNSKAFGYLATGLATYLASSRFSTRLQSLPSFILKCTPSPAAILTADRNATSETLEHLND